MGIGFSGTSKSTNCCLSSVACVSVQFASTIFLFVYPHLSRQPPSGAHGIDAFSMFLSIQGNVFNVKLWPTAGV